MRRVVTAFALTAALLAMAHEATAQTVPQPQPVTGPPPVPSTGSSGLILSVWDTTQAVSLVLYLGLDYDDVAANFTNNMMSDAGLVLNFGPVASFTQTFGASNPNLRYHVFATDGLGTLNTNGSVTTAALGSTFTALNAVQAALQSTSVAGNFYGQIANTCGTTNPCIAGPGLPQPYAGAASWGDRYNASLPVDASAPVGSPLGFYWIDPTSNISSASANVIRYQNSAGNLGTWLLSQAGQLTYSIAGAQVVPLPAAVWLLLSGIAGFGAVSRRRS